MEILEILKYTIPALIVFFTTFIMMTQYRKTEEKKVNLNYILKNRELITPLRLQAYERVILFLERISPESLIMRINRSGMSVKDLHAELLSVIRAEYEHNLSQQVYLSHAAWEYVKIARSNTIKLINTTAARINGAEPSMKLSQSILQRLMEGEETPSSKAIALIKKEIHTLF